MTWQTWRWTEERVALLKKLWGDGYSASRCAARLGGGVTREAVCGNISRLEHKGELAPRGDRNGQNRVMQKSRKHRAPKPWRHLQVFGFIDKNAPKAVAKDGYVPPADEPAPLHQRKTVATLEDDSCRFPLGDPLEASFHFCGAEAMPGSVYCRPHHVRCYVQTGPAKRVVEITAFPAKETADA